MILGAYTFAMNPATCTMPFAKRSAAAAETVGGVEFFSWGTFIEGAEVTMTWEFMTVAQFASLVSLLTDDAQIVWTPGTGTTYNVQILDLQGEYFLDQTVGAQFRKDVTLKLVIISEN